MKGFKGGSLLDGNGSPASVAPGFRRHEGNAAPVSAPSLKPALVFS